MKKILFLIFIMALFIGLGCSKVNKEAGLTSVNAKLIQVMGKVEVIKNGVTAPAVINMILEQNDVIKTLDGIAELKVGKLGLLKVKPFSTLQLSSIAGNAKLNLKEGKVLLALNKLKKQATFEIETPTAVAGVRGTSFLVTASGEDSKIGVVTGKVEVRSFNGFVSVNELSEVSVAGKELKKVSNMNIATIVDVKDILKIKDIESIEGFPKIKDNIKKLEIIEANEQAEGVDVDSLKNAIKAKNMEEENSAISGEIKKKSDQIKSSTVDSSKKKFIKDKEF